MKNHIWLIVILLVTTTLFAAGEKIKPVEEQKNNEAQINAEVQAAQNVSQYKVTFIELGSVKCVPCKMMQPIMDQVEKEYPDVQVVFHDVWTEAGTPYAQKYGIRGIPTQIFLDKEGNEYARHVGFFPKEELVKVLEEGLQK